MNLFRLSATLFILATIAITVTFYIQFEKNCAGYLKQAVNSSSASLANERLTKAINYIESKNLTEGYTSILYETPGDDIGFWYKNLKSAQSDISKINSNTSKLEEANMLMKLREVLTDESTKGSSISMPPGISRYPYNFLIGIAQVMSCFLFILMLIVTPD